MCQREVDPGGGKGPGHPGLINGLQPFTHFAIPGNPETTPSAAFAFSRLQIDQSCKLSSLLQRYVYLRIDWILLINLPHHRESLNVGDSSHGLSYI